jgi:hypothetical protein
MEREHVRTEVLSAGVPVRVCLCAFVCVCVCVCVNVCLRSANPKLYLNPKPQTWEGSRGRRAAQRFLA